MPFTSRGSRGSSCASMRRGEELDVAAADAWLRAHVTGLRGTPAVTQFSGGASNWTYRLQYESRDLVLRRPPAGTKARSAHDVGREYRLQQALKPVFPQVPEMIAHCPDEAVIGAEFYVMEHIPGIIPRKNFVADRETARRLCHRFLDTLIALHRVDFQAAGLAHLGKGAGYVRRQVEGWCERYRKARTWNVPRGTSLMRWLADNMPAAETICVTHNDFRFDNVVLAGNDPASIVAVLDWELAALGDPWMDVGNMLAYWVEAGDDFVARATRRQPTQIPGMLTRREVIEYYARQTNTPAASSTFYEVFGLFRLSAIAQQIYYRYHRGETRNPAFKNFWAMVNYLHWRCRRLI